MKIRWRASRHESIRHASERDDVQIDWPDHVPVPQIGDRLLYKNGTVTIVDREYSGGGLSVDDGNLKEMQLTLVWRDRRFETRPLIRDSELGPEETPKVD